MNENMITWNDNDSTSKANAMSQFSESIDAYGGFSKTQGNTYRHFIDIEPNRSVRPGFNQSDYYAFRPNEAVPNQQRRIIKMCAPVGLTRRLSRLADLTNTRRARMRGIPT